MEQVMLGNFALNATRRFPGKSTKPDSANTRTVINRIRFGVATIDRQPVQFFANTFHFQPLDCPQSMFELEDLYQVSYILT